MDLAEAAEAGSKALPALIETWVLYGVGTLIIFTRIICRTRMIGVRNFQPDDYLIIPAWITYTVMTVCAHIVGGHGDLHALNLKAREDLFNNNPEVGDSFIIGTKWFCAGVATYITFIWFLKINMLFLYRRIVNGLWVERFIMPIMGLVVLTYIAIMMIIYLPCRPYHRMWILFPDQGEYCKPQSTLNMVPPLVMNLVTDLCIMLIPAPVILPLKTTVWRKIGLVMLFFAGLFIMVFAILRVYFVLVAKTGPAAAIWSCREDAVAILVTQAILIRPIFTKKFWNRNHSFASSVANSKGHNKGTGGSSGVDSTVGGGRRSGFASGFRKVRDPFSVTAALATVQDNEEDKKDRGGRHQATTTTTLVANENDSTENLKMGEFHSSGSSVTALSTLRRETPTPEDVERGEIQEDRQQQGGGYQQYHHQQQQEWGLALGGPEDGTDGRPQQYQYHQQQQPAGLVINVSRQVEVEKSSSPTGRTRRQSDYLHATNKANCWNGNRD